MRYPAACHFLPLGTFFSAARSRTACDALRVKYQRFSEGVRCPDRWAANDTAFISDLSHVSAGGLRSRAAPESNRRPQAKRVGCMGADTADGLEAAEREYAGPYTG